MATRVIPVNGAYWQAFGLYNTGAGCVPSVISGCAAANMLEGVFSRIIRGREGALGASPRLPRRAFVARFFLRR